MYQVVMYFIYIIIPEALKERKPGGHTGPQAFGIYYVLDRIDKC